MEKRIEKVGTKLDWFSVGGHPKGKFTLVLKTDKENEKCAWAFKFINYWENSTKKSAISKAEEILERFDTKNLCITDMFVIRNNDGVIVEHWA